VCVEGASHSTTQHGIERRGVQGDLALVSQAAVKELEDAAVDIRRLIGSNLIVTKVTGTHNLAGESNEQARGVWATWASSLDLREHKLRDGEAILLLDGKEQSEGVVLSCEVGARAWHLGHGRLAGQGLLHLIHPAGNHSRILTHPILGRLMTLNTRTAEDTRAALCTDVFLSTMACFTYRSTLCSMVDCECKIEFGLIKYVGDLAEGTNGTRAICILLAGHVLGQAEYYK
jgi:hypothetical protein